MYVDTWLQLSYDIANIQNPGPKLAATTASAFLAVDSKLHEIFEVGVFQTGSCLKALQSATAYVKTSCIKILMVPKEATRYLINYLVVT